MIKPKALKQGSRVAVLAPSSCEEPERVAQAEQAVRDFGLEPVMYPSCYARHGYLAGNDAARAADVQNAFEDDSIEGIIALRGGYGCARLLGQIDFDRLKQYPKVFVGYSDVTALHIALNQICEMVTFHGVMASAWQGEKAFTMQSLRQNICEAPQTLGEAAHAQSHGQSSHAEIQNPHGEEIKCLIPGAATGYLTGGNLSILTSTLGSAYEIDTSGKILLLEDVGEALYRVDRMLTSLALAGKFKDAAGIILGTWKNCHAQKDGEGLAFSRIIKEIIGPYNKPMINNFRVGHVSPQITVPLGIQVRLDATLGLVTYLESPCI